MSVDDQYLLAAVTSHFIGCFLQELELEPWTVGNGSRLMLCLKNLAEIVFRKYYRVLLLRSVDRGIAGIDEVISKWQVRTMLFKNAERQYAGSARLLNCLREVSGGQLFPFDGQVLSPENTGEPQVTDCISSWSELYPGYIFSRDGI